MNLKKILPFFSYLFHPLFIPAYAALFYFFYNDTYYTSIEKYVTLIQIAIVTILLPLLFFILLRAAGKVDSLMLANVSQRKLPLIIQCFLTILLLRKSITIDHYPELHFFFLAGLLSTILALILLFFQKKASLHLMSMGAITLFIIGLSIHSQIQNNNLIAGIVLLNGVVASSRIEMNAHTGYELTIGFFIGIIPQLLLMPIWL